MIWIWCVHDLIQLCLFFKWYMNLIFYDFVFWFCVLNFDFHFIRLTGSKCSQILNFCFKIRRKNISTVIFSVLECQSCMENVYYFYEKMSKHIILISNVHLGQQNRITRLPLIRLCSKSRKIVIVFSSFTCFQIKQRVLG